jgi:hypothetical protein
MNALMCSPVNGPLADGPPASATLEHVFHPPCAAGSPIDESSR